MRWKVGAQDGTEEWYGGAVALDHFHIGVSDFLMDLDAVHRIWVVNTQNSTQAGSHWFTVALHKVGERAVSECTRFGDASDDSQTEEGSFKRLTTRRTTAERRSTTPTHNGEASLRRCQPCAVDFNDEASYIRHCRRTHAWDKIVKVEERDRMGPLLGPVTWQCTHCSQLLVGTSPHSKTGRRLRSTHACTPGITGAAWKLGRSATAKQTAATRSPNAAVMRTMIAQKKKAPMASTKLTE